MKSEPMTVTMEQVPAPLGMHDCVVMDANGNPVLLTGWAGLAAKLLRIVDKAEQYKAEMRKKEEHEKN